MSKVFNTWFFKEVTTAFNNFLNVYLIRYYISMLYHWMWVWFCFLKTCKYNKYKILFFLIDTITIINIHSVFYSWYYLHILIFIFNVNNRIREKTNDSKHWKWNVSIWWNIAKIYLIDNYNKSSQNHTNRVWKRFCT